MSDNTHPPTIPRGLHIFSSVTMPDHEGKQYGVDFLAKDFDDAKQTCRRCGLSVAEKDLGTMEMIVDMTPDGPLTEWDKDSGGVLPDDPNPQADTNALRELTVDKYMTHGAMDRIRYAADNIDSLRFAHRENIKTIVALRAEVSRLTTENAAMKEALENIAAEHEDQSQAWGGEEGDPDNSKYHAKWAKIARAALSQNHTPKE